LSGSVDKTARLWELPTAVQRDAERINLWVAVLTGMELDENDVFHGGPGQEAPAPAKVASAPDRSPVVVEPADSRPAGAGGDRPDCGLATGPVVVVSDRP
jgi:hypothetical protein